MNTLLWRVFPSLLRNRFPVLCRVFPPDARLAACEAAYSTRTGHRPRTLAGYCPLGVMLHHLGICGYPTPVGDDVAWELARAGRIAPWAVDEVDAEADEFVFLWDTGRMSPGQLCDALKAGV